MPANSEISRLLHLLRDKEKEKEMGIIKSEREDEEQGYPKIKEDNPVAAPAVITSSSANNLPLSILRQDFIPLEKVAIARGFTYSSEQIEYFADAVNAPGFKDILEQLKDQGYMLMPGPPGEMSLLEVQALEPELFHTTSRKWCANNEKLSRKDKVTPGILALKKEVVPKSKGKPWEEQLKLLHSKERVPNVAEESYGITTRKKVDGIHLFPDVWVNTNSISSRGHHVYVGALRNNGLVVNDYQVGHTFEYLGLSAVLNTGEEQARKEKKMAGEIFPITVDLTLSLEKMVGAGNYDWVSDSIFDFEITEKKPKKGKEQEEIQTALIHFDEYIRAEEVSKKLDEMGYRPANIRELCAFGAKYPKKQKEFPIVALGSDRQLMTNLYIVACLDKNRVANVDYSITYRILDTELVGAGWFDHFRFLAVRVNCSSPSLFPPQ